MIAHQVHDPLLSQYTYMVATEGHAEAIIVDPACDIDRYINVADQHGLTIVAAFETHLHADFLSGLRAFAEANVPVYVSDAGAPGVRYDWLLGTSHPYHLLRDGDTVSVAGLTIEALHTPSHTPEHLSYVLCPGDTCLPSAVLTGDFLFVGGMGRPMNGDATQTPDASPTSPDPSSGSPPPTTPPGIDAASNAFGATTGDALRRFCQLPPSAQVWPLHGVRTLCGYAPSARSLSTVGQECLTNPLLGAAQAGDTPEHAFQIEYPVPPAYFKRVRRRNRVDPPQQCPPQSPAWITPEQLERAMHQGAFLVDTTSSVPAFAKNHVHGALHVPSGDDFLFLAGAFLPPDAPVYLVLDQERDNGEHANALLQALSRIGLANVEGLFPRRLLQHETAIAQTKLSTIRSAYLPTLAQHPSVMILDVRMPEAYTRHHVPGAVNMPYSQLPDARSALPQEAVLVIVGDTPHHASAAASYLQHNGYNVGCAFRRVPVPH